MSSLNCAGSRKPRSRVSTILSDEINQRFAPENVKCDVVDSFGKVIELVCTHGDACPDGPSIKFGISVGTRHPHAQTGNRVIDIPSTLQSAHLAFLALLSQSRLGIFRLMIGRMYFAKVRSDLCPVCSRICHGAIPTSAASVQ